LLNVLLKVPGNTSRTAFFKENIAKTCSSVSKKLVIEDFNCILKGV